MLKFIIIIATTVSLTFFSAFAQESTKIKGQVTNKFEIVWSFDSGG